MLPYLHSLRKDLQVIGVSHASAVSPVSETQFVGGYRPVDGGRIDRLSIDLVQRQLVGSESLKVAVSSASSKPAM